MKIGSKEPENRQKIGLRIVSKAGVFHFYENLILPEWFPTG